MQEMNFIYPTGVLLQPLVPPPNRKIQHRWVKLEKFCGQEQKDARAKYSRGDLSFFTTRLYNTFLWKTHVDDKGVSSSSVLQENFVAGKKLVLKALTPFQIGEEVCWSSNGFLFPCLAFHQFQQLDFLCFSSSPPFRWVKTTARFSTLNQNRRGKESWKPGWQKKTKKITQQPTIDILCISDIGSHASVQLAKKIGHF